MYEFQYYNSQVLMGLKSEKKFIQNSRKKAIFTQKKVPMYGPNKLVWTINMQGSAFLPLGNDMIYQGDIQIKDEMNYKIIPQINRNIGKIWLKDQQRTFTNVIFPKISMIINATILFLTIVFLVILFMSKNQTEIQLIFVVVSIVGVWLMCCIITIYTFTFSYEKVNFDTQIIRQIKQILCEYNNLYLKDKGYVAKCDQWGIWITVSPFKQQSSRIYVSES